MSHRRAAQVGLLAAVLLCPAAPAGAEPPRALASVDRQRLGTEDTLVLTVRIEGDRAGRAAAPSLSDLRDFRVLQGPSVSSQFQWVNGRALASKSYTYVLMPRRAGQLRVPALRLEAAGEILSTQPIAIEVMEGSTGSPAGHRSSPDARREPEPRSSSAGSAEVRVEAELDRERAYVGQQVTLTYRLLSQLDITGLELVDSPNYTGFWVEDLKVDPNPVGRRVVRDGKEFVEFTVLKKALFPTRAGRLEIAPLTFSLGVRSASGSPFESLFFGTTQSVYRKSPARELTVMALPEEGRPASFGGAVGRFRLTVSPDRQEARVNDAIALKVRVDGEGNVRPVAAPALPPLPDFKTYEPKVEEKSSVDGGGLKGSKTWDFVLLPLAAGPHEIPPLEFSYFDPASGRYHTQKSAPVRLRVARAEAEPGPSIAIVQPREVRPLRADIRHLKPAPARLLDGSRRLARTPTFVALLILPAAGNILLAVARWRREALAAEPGAVRRRRAARQALRLLRRAASPRDGAPAEFYDAVSRALRQYVADKLGRSPAGLTLEGIERALEAAGVGQVDRGRLRSCLEACDRGRFVPAAARPAARADLADQARRAIDSLERRL